MLWNSPRSSRALLAALLDLSELFPEAFDVPPLMSAWGDEGRCNEPLRGPALKRARGNTELLRGFGSGDQAGHGVIMLEIVARYSVRVVLVRDQ
jgi:hypothetical protein